MTIWKVTYIGAKQRDTTPNGVFWKGRGKRIDDKTQKGSLIMDHVEQRRKDYTVEKFNVVIQKVKEIKEDVINKGRKFKRRVIKSKKKYNETELDALRRDRLIALCQEEKVGAVGPKRVLIERLMKIEE